MRPMWAEFPSDEHTFAMEEQYMVGSSLLVAPVMDQGATSATVYFPKGRGDTSLEVGVIPP